jgi:hypothetical protein
MVKGFTVAALLVLLLSSASMAFIDQGQGFIVGNANSVLAIGPDSGAANTNAVTVAQDQLATDGAGHITAFQGEAGSLVQSAGAAVICGALGIVQDGAGLAGQAQAHPGGCTSLGNQDQFLTGAFTQDVVGDGLGSALALQNFVGFQTQLTFTMFGASVNTQGLGVAVWDAFGGAGQGPATAIISGAANFGIGQTGAP